ncbi:MAG: hypothetical protein BRD37_04105 [Bacteroidetes bacterium QH_8_67_23]|nr:MAG: hypothetical protein BRD37_04105 [Bacteroidetes bacterium QH_8_67_23]
MRLPSRDAVGLIGRLHHSSFLLGGLGRFVLRRGRLGFRRRLRFGLRPVAGRRLGGFLDRGLRLLFFGADAGDLVAVGRLFFILLGAQFG